MRTPITVNLPAKKLLAAAISFAVMFLATSTFAQNPPLSLADLLIGLRSKKVSLPERNQILAGAVTERGITFQLTPQIERELLATGAAEILINAIRAKSEPVKPAPTPTPVAVATPIPTPTPPDAAFYQKRADASLVKGELDSALNDYNKAAELKKDDPNIFLGRGRTFFNMKSYDLSVKDFDRVIELSPKTSIAFLDRGASWEKLGDKKKALEDYQAAADLDASNTMAIAEVKRIKDELAVAEAPPKPAEPVKPEFMNLGVLGPDSAVRMIVPTYSAFARQARVEGRVMVDVELDEEGNVVSAKVTSGHAMLRQSAEDAARRSKFKPAMFNGVPIKAKGIIMYNFNL